MEERSKALTSYSRVNLDINKTLCRAHCVGRVVSVRGCVAEEDAHFVHGHRLDLLPAAHPHQQLVQLQLVSVSAGESSAL